MMHGMGAPAALKLTDGLTPSRGFYYLSAGPPPPEFADMIRLPTLAGSLVTLNRPAT